MMNLHLYSEPFARTGNIAAEGFKRLLGRPTLDLLQTVIREAIQNVLDATTSSSGPKFLIRLRTLSPTEQTCLAERVFSERPRDEATRTVIDSVLQKPRLRVLELCDFGTRGLSGPTRADAPHDGEEPLNFVNFLRNVGAGRDTHQGGGTYGYGKSSLYAMSSCSTIVVDSKTHTRGIAVRRLMACHLGSAFDADVEVGERRRFTGRHWWGVRDEDDSIEPATDELALEVSSTLGLPIRGTDDFGTSIQILDPLLGDDGSLSIVDDIIESVLWNFWPRMTASTPAGRRLKVVVELDGNEVAVPSPEEFPPLDLFAAAIADHRNGSPELQPILCGNPRAHLGNLAIKQGLRADRRGSAARGESLIPKQSSHIALMRPVELVVKYIQGDPLPDPRFDWAGVFICSDEDAIEEAFANAEPPAHDDWIADNLPKGRAKTFVRVALRRLREIACPSVVQTIRPDDPAGKSPALAATAAKMGAFLGEVSAAGPGRGTRKPKPPSARKHLSVSMPQFEDLELDNDGNSIARFHAELHNDASDRNLYLIATPYLVVDGSSTANDDLPDGFDIAVKKISLVDCNKSSDEAWIHAGLQGGRVEVLVSTHPGAAVGVRLVLRSGSPT